MPAVSDRNRTGGAEGVIRQAFPALDPQRPSSGRANRASASMPQRHFAARRARTPGCVHRICLRAGRRAFREGGDSADQSVDEKARVVGSSGAPDSSGPDPLGGRGGRVHTRRQAPGAVLSGRTLLCGHRLRMESLHLDRARSPFVFPPGLWPHGRGAPQRRGVRSCRRRVLRGVGDR
jgi:hypothetical protein